MQACQVLESPSLLQCLGPLHSLEGEVANLLPMQILFVALLGLVLQVSIQERIELRRIFASIADRVCQH